MIKVFRHTKVACDTSNCGAKVMVNGNKTLAERTAAQQGWVIAQHGDFCPACAQRRRAA